MIWSAAGAGALALAVVLGAFGAHGLRGQLDAYHMGVYERAVFYHFVHALGLLAVPLFVRVGALGQRAGAWTCWLLAGGIAIFSGSLYLLALTGNTILGAITPLGGVCFIGAWIVLALALVRSARTRI